MNIEQNIINGEPQQDIEDNSGLAEIQQAIEEIEKIKSQEPIEAPEAEEPIKEPEEAEEKIESEKSEEVKKEPEKDRERRLRAEKYKALAEKEEALQKVSQLEQMLSDSLNSGTYHYGKNAYTELEIAKESKKRAIENGDIDALIESDIALTKAISTVNDLEKWANERERKVPDKQEQTEQYYNQLQHEIASDWLDNHSYLQPTSRDYNPKIAEKVAEFVNHLDNNLARNKQMDIHFSEEYFNTIEKFIDSINNEPQKNSKSVGTGPYVGGVSRSSSSPSGNGKSPTQMTLTADEKRMCVNAGITEKEWIKYKLEDLKIGKRV